MQPVGGCNTEKTWELLAGKLLIDSSQANANVLLPLAPPCWAPNTFLLIYLSPKPGFSPGSHKTREAPSPPLPTEGRGER